MYRDFPKMIVRKKIVKFIRQTFFPQKRRYKKMLELSTAQERFSEIYKQNLWSSAESRSGTGSTLEYTRNIQRELSNVFLTYNISSVLDAPCGDFNWMGEVIQNHLDINYIGADIVGELILDNRKKYASKNISFQKLDITCDDLPAVDLMIVRDCLIHLSFHDIYSFLKNFSESDIEFLLVGSHDSSASFVNKPISTGEHRYVNLFDNPVNFENDPLYRFPDFLPPQPFQEQCLFRRDSVAMYLKNFDISKL